MKIKIRSIAYWGLAFAIIVSENFLYLIDTNKYVKGVPVLDIGLVIVVLWVIAFLFYKKDNYSIKYRFKWIMLFPVVLTLTSSIQSNLLYGQNIILGIRPQRYFLLWCISYFPMRKLLASGIISYEKFEKLLYRIGVTELVLYIGQFFLGSSFQIIYAKSNEVYSTTRYYTSTIFLCLLLFICLEKIFQKKKILLNIGLILAIFFEILVVGKMRLTFIAIVAACIIGVLLWRRGGSVKLFTISLGIIAAITVSNNEVIQSIIPALKGTSKIDTMAIRGVGREFYTEVIAEYPLFGGGYINTQWPKAYAAARVSEGIYWVDNGIFGFAYFYGLLGISWVIALFGKIYFNAYKMMRKYNVYLFFVLPIYWIIASQNEVHWYYNFMVMTIFVCLLESSLDYYTLVNSSRNLIKS